MDRSMRPFAPNPPRPSGFDVGSASFRLGSNRASPVPSTPVTPATPSPMIEGTPTGSWRHPNFEEIARRQHATVFDESNVRTIVINGATLFFSWAAPALFEPIVMVQFAYKPIANILRTLPYNWWIFNAVRLFLVFNIALALLPLVRRYYPDDFTDIPLTPSQRKIMGLNPDVITPQTPGSAYASPNYVTPPRYQKSTPRGSFSNQQSPFTGSPNANLGRSTSDSPFSPSERGSPLFQRAMGSGSPSKRSSFGGSMGSSLWGESNSSATPGTPTPGGGRASVGLNNKWLYEKRRESPRSSLY